MLHKTLYLTNLNLTTTVHKQFKESSNHLINQTNLSYFKESPLSVELSFVTKSEGKHYLGDNFEVYTFSLG